MEQRAEQKADETQAPKRREHRHRVHLSVRFERAKEFVIEYAENLSSGGLFVRGAQGLEPGQVVPIKLELPGLGEYLVKARVAHVLGEAEAKAHGRQAGAGFQIVGAQKGCREALRSFLMRLGSRRDHMVLVDDMELAEQLELAGYQIDGLPPPGELLEAVSESEVMVIAAVVSHDVAAAYQAVALSMGAPELIKVADELDELDLLLAALDDELPDIY